MALLDVKALTKRFGGLTAVDNVEFSVEEKALVGIIGPNGAGKTTLFNLISGALRPTEGKVVFDGKDITYLSSHARAARGLARTFQTTSLFHELSVLDNVLLGHHLLRRSNVLTQLIATRRVREEEANIRKIAEEMLTFLGLSTVKNELAKNLPHGHQRALGIALALASQPRLLLLDEPVTGMNESETATMMQTIRCLRSERDITVVLVEHDMTALMGLSDYVFAISFGKKIAEGLPEEIVRNEHVIDAYLGTQQED